MQKTMIIGLNQATTFFFVDQMGKWPSFHIQISKHLTKNDNTRRLSLKL